MPGNCWWHRSYFANFIMITRKGFPHYRPFVSGIHRSLIIFSEQAVEQTVEFRWSKTPWRSCDVTVMMLSNYLCVWWIQPGHAWWPEANTGWWELDLAHRPGREVGRDLARTYCNTTLHSRSLKRKSGSCHFNNFRCSHWWNFIKMTVFPFRWYRAVVVFQSTHKRRLIGRPKWRAMMCLCIRYNVILERDIWTVYMYNNVALCVVQVFDCFIWHVLVIVSVFF